MMQENLIAQSQKYYEDHLGAKFGQPVGASAAEIRTPENELGFALPTAYRQFVAWVGLESNGQGPLESCHPKYVIGNNRDLPAFLKECGVPFQPGRPFICPYFANYHVAVWFYCDEDAADPRVNVFRESSQWGPEFNRWTFSNWLLQELNGSLLI